MTAKKGFNRLLTEAGEKLLLEGENALPWDRYPRPSLVRKEWQNLNGAWDFFVNGEPRGKITVPFCPESALSRADCEVKPGDSLTYTRFFTVPEHWREGRALLHFGAVSRDCRVYVNGSPAAENANGFLPFEADVTELLKDNANELRVEAVNDLDPRYPYGKQTKKRGGMWYTPFSGIWQTVWLEPVPEKHIKGIDVEVDGRTATVVVDGFAEGTVECGGKVYIIEKGKAVISPEDPVMWSPEEPKLYDFTVKCGQDEVSSYFGLRTLEIKTVGGIPRLCLNGKPYFFNSLLDQGYFSDGLSTPADPGLFAGDIKAMKALGFNTLRKHIKVEPELFYYECDRLGMAVFQDMVNNGEYSFLRDTLLPTVGVKNLNDKKLHRDELQRRVFVESAERTVRLLKNHPCICLWTLFNEGWGQFDTEAVYDRIRSIDGSRFIDSASGWFRPARSDVESLHVYFGKIKMPEAPKKPVILSEFGGYVYKLPEHSFNLDKTYGYRLYKTRDSFKNAFEKLFRETVAPLSEKGLSAAVYTQVSDVEDETNGLLTYDRKIMKLEEDGPEGFV